MTEGRKEGRRAELGRKLWKKGRTKERKKGRKEGRRSKLGRKLRKDVKDGRKEG